MQVSPLASYLISINLFSFLPPPILPTKSVCWRYPRTQLQCPYCFLCWEVCTFVILFTSLRSLRSFSIYWTHVLFIHCGQKNLWLPLISFYNELYICVKYLTFLRDLSSSWQATLFWSLACHRRGRLQAVIKRLSWVTSLAWK